MFSVFCHLLFFCIPQNVCFFSITRSLCQFRLNFSSKLCFQQISNVSVDFADDLFFSGDILVAGSLVVALFVRGSEPMFPKWQALFLHQRLSKCVILFRILPSIYTWIDPHFFSDKQPEMLEQMTARTGFVFWSFVTTWLQNICVCGHNLSAWCA